ncbi:MAG: response regulator [Magnetococcales bacterium]|nr:response regulator [Magnetococcales bacterium]NGZ25500.1 response regulator [Magnetococcales bacterium]
MRLTLPNKIALLAFFCMLLGMAGVALLGLTHYKQLAYHQYIDENHQRLQEIAGEFQQKFDSLSRYATLLATSSTTRHLLTSGSSDPILLAQWQEMVRWLMASREDTILLWRDQHLLAGVKAGSGGKQELCCTTPPQPRPEGQQVAITLQGVDKEPRLQAAVQVRDQNGQVLGWLTISSDFAQWTQGLRVAPPMEGIYLSQNGQSFLYFHASDTILPTGQGVEERFPGMTALLGNQEKRGTTDPLSLVLNTPRQTLVQARRVPLSQGAEKNSLILLGEFSTAPVKGVVGQYGQSMWMIVLLTTLSLSLLIALASTRMTRPIRQLTQLAEYSEATEEGIAQLSKEIVPLSKAEQSDDLDRLIHAFQQLVQRLASAHTYSRVMAETLERQVMVRTSELEEALHQAQAGEKSRSEFLSLMSHELRTPLNQSMGMLELIQTTPLTPQQQEYVQFALSASTSLLSLLSDILDMARIETGNFELDEVDFDLRELVDGVAANFAPQAHAKGIELTAFLPTGIPTAMRGDPNRLRQIFSSLIGNSIKFSETGGMVEIHGGIIHKRDDGTAELMFEVRDSGIGISEEDRGRIFGIFSQADHSNSRKYGGVGIGLSICRRLVEMMGGEIGVDENPYSNTGSIFYFSVFLKYQNGQKLLNPVDGPKNLRILVVGSSGLQLTMLENALASWGSNFGHVAQTSAARVILEQAAMKKAPYQLVIYNQKSGQDGREDLAMLELTCPFAGYLLLSDRLDQALDQAAGLPGAAVCLKKPFSVDRLYGALLRLLSVSQKKESAPLVATIAEPEEPKEVQLNMADILVVDDQPTNLKLAQLMLARLGCDSNKVTGAASGDEAIRKFREKGYHLVFMDCQMPGMDGYQTTRHLRALEQELGRSHTPIVALTADATEDSRKYCLEVGMDDHQSKPINMAELQAKLQNYLLRRKTAPSSSTTQAKAESTITVDVDAAMESIGLPQDAYSEVAELIVTQIPQLMESLEDDLRGERYESARAKSHVLKGSMANTLFPTMKAQTLKLHNLIRDQHFNEAIHVVMTMRGDFIPIHKALTAYVLKTQPA